MNRSILTAAALLSALSVTPLAAQTPSTVAPPYSEATIGVPNESVYHSKPSTEPTSAADLAAPLNLRSGAVATGLRGFYDYQSNGMTRGRLYVSPTNPAIMYAACMVAASGADETTVGNNRRVGFVTSKDGGKTWTANNAIDVDLRLGYPYLGTLADGTPLVACHGDPDGAGPRTLMYVGSNDGTFFRASEFDRPTVSGRTGTDGAGVIWPAMVISPKNAQKAIVFATLSNLEGTGAAPIHYAVADAGSPALWSVLADSSLAATSGGRNPMAVSAGGKVGIAYYKTGTRADAGIYFSESSDGGTGWSEPVKVIGFDYTDEKFVEGDTLGVGTTVDLIYRGEEPFVTVAARRGTLYINEGIYCWSPSYGAKRVVEVDTARGLGQITAVPSKAQPNMAYVSFPTASTTTDGKYVMVVFQASSQESRDVSPVVSEEGFSYFRLWGIASRDGGESWGDPFIVQDFAGNGTDSANIDYPSADARLRVREGKLEHRMIFQAKAQPGMSAFVVVDIDGTTAGNQPADRGSFSEAFSYYQTTLVDSSKFGKVAASAPNEPSAHASSLRPEITSAYANGTSGAMKLSYRLPTSGATSVGIYDLLGRRVLSPVENQAGYPGEYTPTVDISSLRVGFYQVVVEQSGQLATRSFSVVR